MDLTFHTEKGRFNYRVGAIILKDDQLLAVKNERSSYYYTVGGRVHFDENCEDAVKREVYEELGIHLEVDRPLFFHENFFTETDSHEHFHEIAVYYLMKNSDELNNLECHLFTENGMQEELHWIFLDQLQDIILYPQFLKTKLLSLPDSPLFLSER